MKLKKKKSPLLLNGGSGDPWREHRVRNTSVPALGVNKAVEKPGHRIISASLVIAFKLTDVSSP